LSGAGKADLLRFSSEVHDELKFIEVALARHRDVQQAVVTEMEITGGQELLAYVAGRTGVRLTAKQLKDHLIATVSGRTTPVRFLILESLPLQSDGRVDREALPLPDTVRPDLTTPYDPPRNPIEASIAEIWARLLGLDRVGTRDSFSELGGDSLLAVQIGTEIWYRFGIEIAENSIVGSTTVADLTEAIS
jgi:acyl carrier protein